MNVVMYLLKCGKSLDIFEILFFLIPTEALLKSGKTLLRESRARFLASFKIHVPELVKKRSMLNLPKTFLIL